jgi:hypothetical protein
MNAKNWKMRGAWKSRMACASTSEYADEVSSARILAASENRSNWTTTSIEIANTNSSPNSRTKFET